MSTVIQATRADGRKRWTAIYEGARHIVWARTVAGAATIATVHWGTPQRIEPAAADWRTADRVSSRKSEIVAIRVTPEEMATLVTRYGRPLSRNVLRALLD